MSQFYGTLEGQAKTTATRRGSKNSGVVTKAASWAGCIETRVYQADDGKEYFTVTMRPWQGRGDTAILASGPIGDVSNVHFHTLEVKAASYRAGHSESLTSLENA